MRERVNYILREDEGWKTYRLNVSCVEFWCGGEKLETRVGVHNILNCTGMEGVI